MKTVLKILGFLIAIVALVFLVFWCISSVKGISFVDYVKSIFTNIETAVSMAKPSIDIGGGFNV